MVTATTTSAATSYLVVPGQVIATSSLEQDEEGGGFLRGHGTYIEKVAQHDAEPQQRLVASVAGTVERVNKLISVIPVSSSLYEGHVGDLVVGRIVSVGNNRWRVGLGSSCRSAQLPLSGVHLPGGVQRVRTAEDARDMRQFFTEGDLVSAEVHNVHQDGTLVLHTRSMRYGKLENGCLIQVPPALVPRQKNHYTTLLGMDVLWGTNGYIWIQRSLASQGPSSADDNAAPAQLVETQEVQRKRHAETPVLPDERKAIARFRNAIQCLVLVHTMITPESTETVYQESLMLDMAVKDMLQPTYVVQLTESFRNKS